MLFSQIIPPSLSRTESKSLFFMSVLSEVSKRNLTQTNLGQGVGWGLERGEWEGRGGEDLLSYIKRKSEVQS